MKQFEAVRAKVSLEALGRIMPSVKSHLDVGEAMVSGDVAVEPIGCGLILVTVGRGLALAINPCPGGAASVTAYYDCTSKPPPHVAESTPTALPSDPPLCRFGPGGEYARDYTPGEPSDRSSVISDRSPAKPLAV